MLFCEGVRMNYMILREAGEKWGVTPRRINCLCAAGRIPRRGKDVYVMADTQGCSKAE